MAAFIASPNNNKKIEIVIDGYGAYKDQIDGIADCDNSYLLRINDGRKNLRKKAKKSDEKRINVRFVSVLCDGWPIVLLQTTKFIAKRSALWMDYGPFYKNVLDQIEI